MPTVSLLTIVKGRRQNLHNQMRGIRALTQVPGEVIVVHMNEPTDPDLPDPGCKLVEVTIKSKGEDQLPIARARNHAATLATGEILVFLDVDCIPAPTYPENLVPVVEFTRGLVMGNPLYLPVDSGRDDWAADELAAAAMVHPRRPPIPSGGYVPSEEYHLFWSLCFGIYKETFLETGGFDENYRGYGGEDTDFAFTARAAGIRFFLADARVYHQHHVTHSPPLNHVEDLVVNANAFRKKWGGWPMEGWLRAFQDAGLIKWTEDELSLLRLPTEGEIQNSRSVDPFA
ncbi:glycosyltransferase family 2 protein [Lewinella sp. 4G2]|uniref:glycosyltransferase family 2 protein n=1 Tax=Lewinella sp. 4G2 TaxID=1803372 RepID=UPI0007B4F58D|nr:galactosyltransferase-related protein [Lewinella sp. 4G2]OAV44164.1 hypothetical protein A3850_006485 [Lewinella sp. 4G2]